MIDPYTLTLSVVTITSVAWAVPFFRQRNELVTAEVALEERTISRDWWKTLAESAAANRDIANNRLAAERAENENLVGVNAGLRGRLAAVELQLAIRKAKDPKHGAGGRFVSKADAHREKVLSVVADMRADMEMGA